MINGIEAPKGFIVGKANQLTSAGIYTYYELKPAYIRMNADCADVIFIQKDGDYTGLFQRMPHNAVVINMTALPY